MNKKIRNAIYRIAGDFMMTPSDDLNRLHDLGDSLERIEFVMAVEEEFSIEITDDELYELKNVGDFIRLVEEKTHDA